METQDMEMSSGSPAQSPKRTGWLGGLRIPLTAAFGAACIMAVCSLFIPNSYVSEASVLPAETRGALGGMGGNLSAAAAALGVSLPGQEGQDANYPDIVNSRWTYENLLAATYRFHARSWRFGADKLHEETLYHYLGKRNMDKSVEALRRSIGVNRDQKTKLVKITVETRSPELSQLVCQKCVKLLETFVIEHSQTRGGFKAAFARRRLVEAREEQVKAEEAFRVFLNGNRNYLVSADPSVRLQGLRLETELKLRTQIVMTLSISQEQALMDEKNDVPILNVLDTGNLPAEKSKPARSSYVMLAFFLAGAAAWLWLNRKWVMELVDLKNWREDPATGA
jgi:hypothetical protein